MLYWVTQMKTRKLGVFTLEYKCVLTHVLITIIKINMIGFLTLSNECIGSYPLTYQFVYYYLGMV